MIIRELKFTVPGDPRGKQRPRVTRAGIAYTPKETVNYENLVKVAFTENFPEWIPIEGCVGMHITSFSSAPKSMPKKLMPFVKGETLRHEKKPDYDNIAKIVCDALNQIAYKDDKQITDFSITKRYSLKPRVEVTIELLGDVDYERSD